MFIKDNRFSQTWLAAGSSPVDWCEDNYKVSSYIAEFTNTVSNISFFLIVPILFASNFWNAFYQRVSVGAHIQFIMLLVIAASSMYFHASLSLMGQLLDEVAIIWAICFGFASFMPKHTRPSFFHGKLAYGISALAGIVLTGLWFVSPYINAFVLMLTAVPIILLQHREIERLKFKQLKKMSFYFSLITCLAVSFWIADRTMCGVWKKLNIPGLHSLWHITVSIAFYYAVSIYSFLKTVEECPSLRPTVKSLPDCKYGLPYLHVNEQRKSSK